MASLDHREFIGGNYAEDYQILLHTKYIHISCGTRVFVGFFPNYKSVGANNPWSVAILDASGI